MSPTPNFRVGQFANRATIILHTGSLQVACFLKRQHTLHNQSFNNLVMAIKKLKQVG
jgi:hypothetical protein